MDAPHYLRFARALALISGTSFAAIGCASSQPCALAGQACTVGAPRPAEAGCGCICLAAELDTGTPPPDGGALNGVWGGGCGGPLAPPELAIA